MPRKRSLSPDEVKRRATVARQKYRDKHVVVYLRKDTVGHLEAIGGVGGANLRNTVDMLIHEYIYSDKGQPERARYEKVKENSEKATPSTSAENSGAHARPLLDVINSTPETMIGSANKISSATVNSHVIKGDPQLLARLAKKKKKKHKREKLKASTSVYDHFGVSGNLVSGNLVSGNLVSGNLVSSGASHLLTRDMTPAAAAAWASSDGRDMMVSDDPMYDRSRWNFGPSDELYKNKKRGEHKKLKVKTSAYVWDQQSAVSDDHDMVSGDMMYDESRWNVGSGSDEVSKNKRKRREPRKLKTSVFLGGEQTAMSGDHDVGSGDESGWNGVPASDSDGAAKSETIKLKIKVKIEPEDRDESEICKTCCLKFPTAGDFLAHQQRGCIGEINKDSDAHYSHSPGSSTS